jgi:hypothetical protein
LFRKDLFRVICERDMEGIVAKQASGRYTPEAELGEDLVLLNVPGWLLESPMVITSTPSRHCPNRFY